MNESKTCSRCQQVLPLSAFGKNRSRKDGLHVYCRPCQNERSRLWVEANQKRRQEIVAKSNESRRELNRQWRLDNREALRAKKRQEYVQKKDEYLRRARESYRRNPEAYKRRAVEHQRLHVDEKRRRTLDYRARLLRARRSIVSTRDIAKITRASCTYCGSSERITVDHVIPLSRGGLHSIGNLTPACLSCNASKGAQTVMEWRLRRMRNAPT